MSAQLKPIAVKSLSNLYNFIFETTTDNLNCEQVAAGYNGLIVDNISLHARIAAQDRRIYELDNQVKALNDVAYDDHGFIEDLVID